MLLQKICIDNRIDRLNIFHSIYSKFFKINFMKRIFTLTYILNLTCILAVAQPVLKQQRTAGGNDDDEFTSMWLTSDGGGIAGGFSLSNRSYEKTENSKGIQDYWIIKYDSLGNIQWDKTIGGADVDRLYALQQTSDKGYILGGYSFSNKSGDKTEDSKGVDDYWIVKLDSTGNIQWDKVIGGSSSDELYALQQTADGGYILGGSSSSTVSGDKTQKSRGGYDYWVVKLDNLGNIEWDRTIGGNRDDLLKALQQTPDGGYILGGYSSSGISGEKTDILKGSQSYWVVKINNKGNVVWDKTLGTSGYSFLNCLALSNDGGYLIGGRAEGGILYDKTDTSRGGWDYWILKLTESGSTEWDKTIGGKGNENLSSVQQAQDGGYILAGNSSSDISGEKTENSKGGEDYWIVKTDSIGNIQWNKTIGGSSVDVPGSIKEIQKDQYAVGGRSDSKVSGDKKQLCRGNYDYWFVRLVYKKDAETEMNNLSVANVIPKKRADNVLVFPDPAKNLITINFSADQNGPGILEITNANDKIELYKKIATEKGNNTLATDISYLASGVYFIRIITAGGRTQLTRVIKE
jgi:hypothetical protein